MAIDPIFHTDIRLPHTDTTKPGHTDTITVPHTDTPAVHADVKTVHSDTPAFHDDVVNKFPPK